MTCCSSDDFALAPLQDQEQRDLLEILEDRYGARSTIVTSQLPVAMWHEALGEPTVADGILDRLLHNVHRVELHGESMRRGALDHPDMTTTPERDEPAPSEGGSPRKPKAS